MFGEKILNTIQHSPSISLDPFNSRPEQSSRQVTKLQNKFRAPTVVSIALCRHNALSELEDDRAISNFIEQKSSPQ